MSCTNYFNQDLPNFRASKTGVKYSIPAGVKKVAKKSLQKAKRQQENLMVQSLALEGLQSGQLTSDELEAMANAWLEHGEAIQARTTTDLPDTAVQCGEDDNDGIFRLELPLAASLPDWMVDKLESTGGYSLEMMSILEVKDADGRGRNKRFAVSLEDDVYDCEAQ